MRRLLGYLLEFIGLALLGFVELDRRIFPLFGPLVRFWSKWTGKSNFTLARLLVLLGCLMGAGGVARFLSLISAGTYREEAASVVMLLFVFIFLATLYLREIPYIERLVEEADEKVLPQELYISEVYWSLLRPLIVFLCPIAVWTFVEEDILLNIFAFTAMFLVVVTCFVLFHYNHGGKSKLKEVIRQVVRRLSFSPIPSPLPAPSN